MTQASSFISLKNVRSISVRHSIDETKKLLRTSVTLPRLPRQHTLQALKLLRECWDSYDVVMYSAIQYKRCSRAFMFLTLILNAMIVICTSVLFEYGVIMGDFV